MCSAAVVIPSQCVGVPGARDGWVLATLVVYPL